MTIDFTSRPSEKLSGVTIITPSIFEEERGLIWTSYLDIKLKNLLPKDLYFKHDKFSESKFNVLRGIHGDNKSWKLVSCIYGSLKQVIVDMRKSSKTYLKWESFDLGNKNKSMILIPPGMGNAFCVTSSYAIYHYKLAYDGEYIDANEQFTIAWNSPKLNIDWPTSTPILLKRDRIE